MDLTSEQIAELLRPSNPSQQLTTRRQSEDIFNMPRSKHVHWLEHKLLCREPCRTTAYMKIDGVAVCLKHAVDELIRLVDRVENPTEQGVL